MPWSISYYSEKVEREVLALPAGILARYLRITEMLQEFGVDIGMPYSKALGDGLFELRPRSQGGIARVLYCTMAGKTIVVLHSFVKKTQDTPKKELELARQRMKEVKRNG